MRSPGYLVTREEMDAWSVKRPEYSLSSMWPNKCVSRSEVPANYYATCPSGDTMPTFDEMAMVHLIDIPITNYATAARSVRIGWKTASGTMTYSNWTTIMVNSTETIRLEGLPVNVAVYFYLYVGTTGEVMNLIVDDVYQGALANGAYFIRTPIISSTQQQSGLRVSILVGALKVNIRVTTNHYQMRVAIFNASYSDEQEGSDLLFTGVPWNDTVSVEAWNVTGYYGANYTANGDPDFESFDVLSAGMDYINIEVNTGDVIFKTEEYAIEILADV